MLQDHNVKYVIKILHAGASVVPANATFGALMAPYGAIRMILLAPFE